MQYIRQAAKDKKAWYIRGEGIWSEKIIALILMVSVLSESFFFSFYALLGKSYGGSAVSLAYQVYLVILLLANIMIRISKYIETKKIRYIEICLLVIPVFYIIATVFTCINYKSISEAVLSETVYFIVWQYTAILAVINLKYYSSMESILYTLDWFVLVVFLGGCRSTLTSLGQVSNSLDTFGGATYQAASYFMAFAFGINTFLLLMKKKICFLERFKTSISTGLRLIFSLAFICLVLFSGGRAGIILVFAYLLVLTWWTWNDRRFSFNIWCLGVVLCICLMFFVLTILIDNPIFYLRINRVFEYFSGNGLDFSKTSGRDIIYSRYLGFIGEKPLFGYGILSYNYFEHYAPHNIILGILVEGGFLYLTLWGVIIMWIYKKWRNDKSLSKYFLYVMAIYPLIRTMFSANYLNEEIFWFSIVWGVLGRAKWRKEAVDS